MATQLIRLKPDERRGSHTIHVGGRTFTFERRKWYEVDADREAALIAKCKRTRVTFGNPKSPLLFDVVTPEEARTIHRQEAEKIEPRATPDEPVTAFSKPLVATPSQVEVDAARKDIERMLGEARAAMDAARAERESAERVLAEAQAVKAAAEDLATEAMRAAAPVPPVVDEKGADEAPPAEPKGGKGSAKR